MSTENEEPLDDETERLIRECAVAHRRGFYTPSTSDYPRAFNALRNRIRTLVEEARSCPKDTAYRMGVPR